MGKKKKLTKLIGEKAADQFLKFQKLTKELPEEPLKKHALINRYKNAANNLDIVAGLVAGLRASDKNSDLLLGCLHSITEAQKILDEAASLIKG